MRTLRLLTLMTLTLTSSACRDSLAPTGPERAVPPLLAQVVVSAPVDLGTFPASVKAALDLLGRPGGRTRDPIRPLTAEQREKLRRAMESAGLIEPVRALAGGKA